MKPQLYSIVILLLARINYVQNADSSTQNAAASSTELPLTPPSKTSVATPREDNAAPTTKAPGDDKTAAPETTENNVTPVTKAPTGSTTSVSKTSRETGVSEIPTGKVTVLPEAPNSKATSAPSLAPSVPPVHTTEGFTMTTRGGSTARATGSTSISTEKQTSNPIIVAGNTTTQRINKVTDAVRKTTRPTSTKPTTEKAPENRSSAFPGPSLFAIVLLVISVLCF